MSRKQISERIKYWSQLLLLPVYGLSFFMPRNRNIWVFGSTFGRRFTDNSRYYYLYIKQNHPQVHAIWISHNKDVVRFLKEHHYEAYYYHSAAGIWYALRAGVYIFDNYSKDINFWQSGGAIKMNLWHGSGNKRTNYDNIFDQVRRPKNAWEQWKTFPRRLSDEKPNHYTLATSPAMRDIFVSAFHTDIQHIIVAGYPRNDMLFSHSESHIENLLTEAEKALCVYIEDSKKKGYRILSYIPTFRNSEKKFFEVMELDTFDRFLEEQKLILITKLHPKSKLQEEFNKLKFHNIHNGKVEIDVYTFLSKVDLLITDYSSVYTDYMLLDRPVIGFQYDFEEYSNETRECYIEQDEYMPERKAVNMNELMASIIEVIKHDQHKEKRAVSRQRMFSYTDGKSSERLYRKMTEIL